MSDAQTSAFSLRLSDGRSIDLPIGAKMTAGSLPGLYSAQPGGPVARVTTHPTDPASYGFQNLSQSPWRVWLPDGKKVEIAPGKNVLLQAGILKHIALVDGERRQTPGGQLLNNKRWTRVTLGRPAVICLSIFAALYRAGHSDSVQAGAVIPAQASTTGPKPLTAAEIAQKSQTSVVTVVMVRDPKRMLKGPKPMEYSQGSGFVVDRNLVVTNLHVIDGNRVGGVKFIGEDTIYQITDFVAVDPDHDLALLRIDGPDVASLTLARDELPQRGEQVYVWGTPEGLEATFSDGKVSAVRTSKGSGERLQITAPISHGSSGGPVLNSSGEVIAVTVATLSEGQNINFAIPVKYIRTLLKK
jgi:hypothetical protein